MKLSSAKASSPSYFTRLVRLSYLAPDIAHAILDRVAAVRSNTEELIEH